jgi:hypothetical protein
MSTYRYARESRTSAQRAAREWQRKVDETKQELAMYDRQVADGRLLSNYDAMRQRNATRRLEKLMAENPNEAA